jgi:hypothetical protein
MKTKQKFQEKNKSEKKSRLNKSEDEGHHVEQHRQCAESKRGLATAIGLTENCICHRTS